MRKKEVGAVLDRLAQLYPEAKTALNFDSPFQLLVSTILAAQCTDERVNKVTAELFKKYRTPADFAGLDEAQLAEEIKSCGLFRNKSRNIIAMSQELLGKHNGEVPVNFDDLVQLPGVGRKTANVVLANAFNIPALAVDTHVFRVANRLGLAAAKDPDKTEEALQQVIPQEKWNHAHHWLIYHGRRVCLARKPRCQECELKTYCGFYKQKGHSVKLL